MRKREHKTFTRRRELTTDYVVFGGRLRRGCFAPFNPIPDAHTPGKRRAKKIRRQRHKRLTYLYPRDILYMLKGDKVFRLTFEDYFITFYSSEVYGSCISRICGFCEFSRQCVLLCFPLLSFSTICQKNNVTEG